MRKDSICNIALIQLTSGDDLHANIAIVGNYIREAAAKGASFIVLPENTFYMRREAHHRDEQYTKTHSPKFSTDTHPGVLDIQALAAELGVWVLIGSIAPIEAESQTLPFNRSVLIDADGNIASTYDKIHLFDAELANGEAYYESERMASGNDAVVAHTPWGGLGLTICYDLRFARLYRVLAEAGAELLTVPAAFTVSTGQAHWHTLLKARAIETGCFVLAPAQCGEHPGGRKSYGHSLVVSPWGEVLADGGDTPGVVLSTINLHEVQDARNRLPVLKTIRDYKIRGA